MPLHSSQKLRNFYHQFSGGDHVLILINADPDAIASSMAVSRLLWRRVATITTCHVNVIKRPDNMAMVRWLGIKLCHIDDVDPAQYTRIVMVDSQPNHHERLAPFAPAVIIDHHPDTEPKAAYTDIRPRYGATATILTEYLQAAKVKPSSKLATALLLAIKNDTANFERQTQVEDLRAFQFLFRHANNILVRKIEQADLRLDFLKYFRIALQEMRLRKGRLFAHLGPVINPDVCVVIADFFMRVISVRWSIVSGIFNGKLILVLRNDGIRKNAGRVAAKAFGQFGSAGGHKSIARAEVDLEMLAAATNSNGYHDRELLRWIIDQIERRADQR